MCAVPEPSMAAPVPRKARSWLPDSLGGHFLPGLPSLGPHCFTPLSCTTGRSGDTEDRSKEGFLALQPLEPAAAVQKGHRHTRVGCGHQQRTPGWHGAP